MDSDFIWLRHSDDGDVKLFESQYVYCTVNNMFLKRCNYLDFETQLVLYVTI